MIALIIFSVITVLVVALMFVNVKLNFEYSDDILLYLKILFFRYNIIYDKKPKQSMSLREYKRREKKKAKKEAKEKSKEKKKKEKKKAGEESAEKKKKETSLEKAKRILSAIKDFSGLILRLLNDFRHELTVNVRVFKVNISCEDVSDTALLYTAISQAMNGLFLIVEDNKVGRVNYDNVECNCDYLSGKMKAEIAVEAEFRVGTVIRLAMTGVYNFLKIRISKGE